MATHAHTTRRALFAAPAALSAGALLPGISHADSASQDAALLAAGREWVSIDAKLARLDEAITLLEEQVVMPPVPKALTWHDGDLYMGRDDRPGERIFSAGVAKFEALLKVPHLAPERMRRAIDVVEADAAYSRAVEGVRDRTGWTALARKEARLCDQLGSAERRIVDLPAFSAEGLTVKARLVKSVIPPGATGDLADRALASLLADLIPCA